ncbi:MAG: glycoside hydrolase family 16 protein [Granulosicoccus sp.]|nr:glycoside hydrolase family 16 protein [Granulosicoccus sp.]
MKNAPIPSLAVCSRIKLRSLHLIQCTVLSLTIASAAPVAVAGPDLTNFDLVFSDEFDEATLNSNNWSTAPIWGPYVSVNGEEQFYIDKLGMHTNHPYSPFLLDGDHLTIRAQPTATAGTPPEQPAEDASIWNSYPEYQYNNDFQTSDAGYLSGIISSVDNFNFTHGYVETRAKVPAGQGLWSAFWLLSTKYVEDIPEIDIIEYLGQNTNEMNHTLHYFDTEQEWTLISTPTYKTNGPDYSQDFHTYGLLWTVDTIIWYIDGVEVKRVTDEEFLIAKQSMYVLSNLAVGGTWPGSPDANTEFPADYVIDYIRVYQKTPPAKVTPAVLANEYQMVFNDEFNGSSLDPSNWQTDYLWGPYFQINNEEQIYLDTLGRHANVGASPFSFGNGTLKITAEEVTPAELPLQPDPDDPEWQDYPTHRHSPDYMDTWTPGYTSGVITSYESFKMVNGYVEFRAKLPAGGGLWPAFWLLNGYYVGPQPEIDVMEMQGSDPATIHHTYHYYGPDGTLVSSPETTTLSSGTYADDFHTYGVQWDPGVIKWYIDGEIVRTYNNENVSNQLMYIIANLAVGGNFDGPVTSSFPKQLEIDYIRAYQLNTTVAGDTPEAVHLDIGAPDDGYYGYNYLGIYDHRSEALFSFNGGIEDLDLKLSSYDIDTVTELTVFVNGNMLTTVPRSGNNTEKPVNLMIPAEMQIDGINTLRFEQEIPGWRWGISQLVLQTTVQGLTIGETDSNRYGYRYLDQSDHRDGVSFVFDSPDEPLRLTLDGYDIDGATEVSTFINDTFLANLKTTPNEDTGNTTVTIPVSSLQPGNNTLEFRQNFPGWKWGITNILLDTASSVVPELTLGVTDTANYGYNFESQNAHRELADFQFTGQDFDLVLRLNAYDIDSSTELKVLLNGSILTHVATTPNNGYATDSIRLPETLQQTGSNSLTFEQKNPGWRWGITDLLLEEYNVGNSLIPGVTDTTKYGYNYDGIYNHREQVEIQFTGTTDDASLQLTAYDIDATYEIEVFLNGNFIGNLPRTPNNGSETITLILNTSDQVSGPNVLRFVQTTPGWRWGITNLLIE